MSTETIIGNNVTTLFDVKNGKGLPSPIYKFKPYVVLSSAGIVLSAGDLDHLKLLCPYFDEFKVQIRQYDLYLNDNTKIR